MIFPRAPSGYISHLWRRKGIKGKLTKRKPTLRRTTDMDPKESRKEATRRPRGLPHPTRYRKGPGRHTCTAMSDGLWLLANTEGIHRSCLWLALAGVSMCLVRLLAKMGFSSICLGSVFLMLQVLKRPTPTFRRPGRDLGLRGSRPFVQGTCLCALRPRAPKLVP